MKTVVLDDDPTGTQSATGVPVFLRWDTDLLVETLRTHPAVYLQTNSRALGQDAAVELASQIRGQVAAAARALGHEIRIVLRGGDDSAPRRAARVRRHGGDRGSARRCTDELRRAGRGD